MLNFQITKLHPPQIHEPTLIFVEFIQHFTNKFRVTFWKFPSRQYKICETNRRLLSKLINSANYFPAA